MPIHLPAIGRRSFLGTLTAGIAGCWAAPGFAHWAPADPRRFALLADSHIAGDRAAVHRGTNMGDNLARVCEEVLGTDPLPAGVLLNGDCALKDGQSGDYETLLELLQPLGTAGIHVHLTLGNHDHRERILAARGPLAVESPLDGRRVGVLETDEANWFLLDSLDRTDVTPGELGAAQREWLAQELDRRPSRPACVLMHHQPQWGEGTGLVDTAPLFDVLIPRRQVKMVVFGHTHHWSLEEREGIHLVNLPPVAYLFAPKDPNGWVDCRLDPSGAVLTLHCLDTAHPQHGRQTRLDWRGAD